MLLDNSGSMNHGDGSRLIPGKPGACPTKKTCTRWEELANMAASMSELAGSLGARTDFHLLNRPSTMPQFVTVAAGGGSDALQMDAQMDVPTFQRAIRQVSPSGSTPLTESIVNIISLVAPAADRLRAHGQEVVVTIATDGLPNDKRSFQQALRQLQALPTWVVVRLCTDDDVVVDYWNELDGSLEVSLEVLDDEEGEAKEIASFNRWLTYAPVLHNARCFGLRNRLFDLVDETKLLPSQVGALIELILGCGQLPDPEADLAAFSAAVSEALGAERPVYDPLRQKLRPWIDMGAITKHCGGGSGCSIM